MCLQLGPFDWIETNANVVLQRLTKTRGGGDNLGRRLVSDARNLLQSVRTGREHVADRAVAGGFDGTQT